MLLLRWLCDAGAVQQHLEDQALFYKGLGVFLLWTGMDSVYGVAHMEWSLVTSLQFAVTGLSTVRAQPATRNPQPAQSGPVLSALFCAVQC